MALMVFAIACDNDPVWDIYASDEFELNLAFRYPAPSGAAFANENVVVDIMVDGEGLFHERPDRCAQQPDLHMSATIRRTVKLDAQGTAKILFSVGDLSSLVDENCKITALNLEQIQGLRIEATAEGAQHSCQTFCQSKVSTDQAACVNDCLSTEPKIFSRAEIPLENVSTAVITENARQSDADRQGPPRLPFALTSLVTFTKLTERLNHSNGPDLRVDAEAITESARITYETWSAQSCVVQEGCLTGDGVRRLLRFAGVIQNLGDQDFPLGNPAAQPELFNYSACHNHYHLREAMKYELLRKDTREPVVVNNAAVVGHKQGFCMLDMRHIADNKPAKYNCTNQGLVSGWADIYSSSLDCQWIDITGVDAGEYLIKVTVNPGSSLFETNYENNSVEMPYTIPPARSPLPASDIVNNGEGDDHHHGGAHEEPDVPEGKPNRL